MDLLLKPKYSFVVGILFVSSFIQAQSSLESFLTPSDSINKPRQSGVYIGESVALGATLIGLNQIWYKDYPQSNFHFFNDNDNGCKLIKLDTFILLII